MKKQQLIDAIITIINTASVAEKLHNCTSAEHWLQTGIASENIRLGVDDNTLTISLLGVPDLVRIPLPTLQVLGTEAIDRLSVMIASMLWLAMSKTTGQGSNRYPEFARLLYPIAAYCM